MKGRHRKMNDKKVRYQDDCSLLGYVMLGLGAFICGTLFIVGLCAIIHLVAALFHITV
jgi:hypothetical protein